MVSERQVRHLEAGLAAELPGHLAIRGPIVDLCRGPSLPVFQHHVEGHRRPGRNVHVDPYRFPLFDDGAGRQDPSPMLLVEPGQRIPALLRGIGLHTHGPEHRNHGGLRYEGVVSFPVPELPGYSQAFGEFVQLGSQV